MTQIASEVRAALGALYSDASWSQPPREEKPPTESDNRTRFDRDRDRIIHSGAFRRLAGKTQVIASPWADRFRTRLTHSLEVAQIGRSIARKYGLDEALVEAACLAHDLGHPPFGHAGERVLNKLMLEENGTAFDANAQTLRVLFSLERKSAGEPGLNLSRACYLAVLKYPYRRTGQLGGDEPAAELARAGLRGRGEGVVAETQFVYDEDLDTPVRDDRSFGEWLGEGSDLPLEPQARLYAPPPRILPCELMDWCDDVAYAVHDFEDAVLAGFVTSGAFQRIRDTIEKAVIAGMDIHYPGQRGELESAIRFEFLEIEKILTEAGRAEDPERVLRPQTRKLLGELIDSSALVPAAGADAQPFGARVDVARELRVRVAVLKRLGFDLLIRDERVIRYLRKGTYMLERCFKELVDDPKVVDERRGQLLPRPLAKEIRERSARERPRSVADFLSSMTESGLTRLYQTIFESTGGSPLY